MVQVDTTPTPSNEHRHDPTIAASRLHTDHEDSVSSQQHKGYVPGIARERPKPSPKKVSSSAVELIIDVPVPGTVNQSPSHIPYTEGEDQLHGAKSVQREETLL